MNMLLYTILNYRKRGDVALNNTILYSGRAFGRMTSVLPFIPAALDEVSIRPGSPFSSDLRIIELEHLNLWQFFPAALGSTFAVRVGLYPLSVLRSRLQLQKQKTVYRGTMHAFTDIAKQEGFRGLFRGFWVTGCQIGCSLIYTTVYEKLRADLQSVYGMTSVAGISSISGGAASFCSQAIFVPTDIVSQYMMIYHRADKFVSGGGSTVIDKLRQKPPGRYLGVGVCKAIYAIDGFKGFYRGFWASSSVYVPYCLVFWPSYYKFQELLKKYCPSEKRSLLLDQAVTAGMGGVVATLATNPMELLRVRMQMHRTTYYDTIARLINEERWSILTKGLPPRLMINSLNSGIITVGYEIVKRLCVLPQYEDRVKW